MKIGYRFDEDSRLTRIWPAEKLIRCLKKGHPGVYYDPVSVVELKDDKGRLKTFRHTAKTMEVSRVLRSLNEINREREILYHREDGRTFRLSVGMVAVYIRKFTLYGRIHSRGLYSYQGLSKEERSRITIDGSPVVEMDYSGMVPHLLYAREGLQLGSDPYSVLGPSSEHRDMAKSIFLRMIYCKDEKQFMRSFRGWVRERPWALELLEKDESSIVGAYHKVRDHHRAIHKYLFRGRDFALRMMNDDAAVAVRVLKRFSSRCVPILSVHDSFLVPEYAKEDLRQVMSEEYARFTRGFSIPIKEAAA